MIYSKYWFVEHSGGLDGLENVRRLSYDEALALAKSIFEEVYEVYPTTQTELYLSEVDIW